MADDKFIVGEQVLVAPDFSNDGFVPFEGTIRTMSDTQPFVYWIVDGDGGDEQEWMEGNIRKLKVPKTKDPVRYNFNPDEDEVHVRRAIHVLSDISNDVEIHLMMDLDTMTFLNAFITDDEDDDESIDEKGQEVITPRPRGTVEYMVCNGPPGDRTGGYSVYTLKEAIALYHEIVKEKTAKKYDEK